MPEDGRSCNEEDNGSLTDTSIGSEDAGEPRHTAFNSEPWGDIIQGKQSQTLRFALANIDSLPMSRTDVKNDHIIQFCQAHDVDFLGLTEPNKCWHKLPTDDRLRERFFGEWENIHTSIAYNKMNPHATQHQVGGTIGMSFNQAAHRVDSIGGGRGQDPTGLGRWTWTRFRGKGQCCLRVAVVYVPCVSTGPLTVWSQHLAYFNANGDADWKADPDPRRRLFLDLSAAMDEWIEAGDQLLVMGDWNGDVRELGLKDFFQKHDMHEALMARHGESAPATCNMGSSPIDGAWVTSSLEISSGGYFNFEEGLPGNHRTLWLDMTYMQALGHSQPAITRPSGRRLKLDDPRCTARYIKYRKAHARQHNLRSKHIRNEKAAHFPSQSTANLQHDINDALTVAGMIWAESKCRKYKGGDVPWSPTVESARREVLLVDALITRRHGQPISSRYIRRMEKHLNVQYHTFSLDQLRRQRRKSKAKYRKLKGTADPLRKSFMKDLADAKAAKNHTSQATELRVMESRREQRALGASMRKLSGKTYQPMLSLSTTKMVTTNNPDASVTISPETTFHTEKEAIELASLNEYEKRLHLTVNSPPMVAPLVHDLGYLGIGSACTTILDGTYPTPPNTDFFASQWLSQLTWACTPADRASPPSIFRACGISTTEHIASWKHSRERIAPGHSGLHPAHWKASCEDPYLASMDAAWANYPILSGYSPARWRHGIDTLIPKKVGSDRVEDLRPILLFEVDCNMANKRIGRVMMEMAERNGGLSQEQYGSRKDHSAGIQALNHCLAFDLLRLERRNGVDTAVDLRSCYDLIVHSVASLSMQRQGVPAPSVVCMFTTLQNMVHTVRTAFGESSQNFGGDLWAISVGPPPQGVGQGNGAGPAIWAVVSTPVLEMMRKNGHGAVFRLAIKGDDVRLVGFAFVDDSDILQTASDLDGDIDELLIQAQLGLDCFVGGMNATGGQVSTENGRVKKCWWYLINFVWNNGKWSYDTDTNSPSPMTVTLPNGDRVPLPQKSPSEAAEVLGVWLAPDGNNDKAVEELTGISRKWADQLRTRPLPKTHAWLAMLTSVSKKLEYPLVALTLTEKQCKTIERPLILQLLKSLGLSRSFPRVVINGPTDNQGLGRRSIYYVMGEIHTTALLRHFSTESLTGSMLQASLQRHNLELGTGSSMFQTDYLKYGRLATPTWLKHNWTFQFRSQIEVDITAPCPTLQKEGDKFLVPLFWDLGYRKANLEALNRCRLYLQVTTLADISSGDGTSILECYWKGQQHAQGHSLYKWPACGNPSKNDWNTWRTALRSLFYDDATSVACRRLRAPLGKWLHSDEKWPWWFSISENRLYFTENGSWRVYLPSTHRRTQTRRSPRFLYSHTCSSGPSDGLRTKVIQLYGDSAFRTTGFVTTLSPAPVRLSNILTERLQTTIPSRAWAMERLQSPDNGLAVAQAIHANTAICVSDGSYKEQHGTAAFVLVDPSQAEPDSSTRIVGCHVAPGRPTDQSPYRSELSGIYGILCVVEDLCALHNLDSGSITIGCDNEKCLWMAINKAGTLSPKSKSFDLLSAIRCKIRTLPIQVRSHWVEGHQDNYSRDPSRLDLWARLNIEMDSLAKLFWEDSTGRQDRQHRIHGETHFISVRGTKICSSLANGLYTACEGHKLKTYWQERKKISASQISSINWSACAGAARMLGIGLRFWKTKHVTGIFANGKWMHRWKFWDHSNCPRCGEPNEDSSHIVQCSSVTPLWTQVVEPLDAWFSKNLTPPDVSAVILESLHAWRTHTAPRFDIDRCSPDLARAIHVQTDIGWGLFLEGFLAAEWELLMSTHYASISSRRSGHRWCCGLIHRLWLLLRDLWEHRNAILHEAVPVETQLATAQLNTSVMGQYNQGLNGLNPSHFRSYFSRPLLDLLALTASYKRNWLANLLAARDNLESHQPISSNRDQERRSLQAWLDLPRRRPRACRLRPRPITQPSANNTRFVPPPRARKRKRSASQLPDNYSFKPFCR